MKITCNVAADLKHCTMVQNHNQICEEVISLSNISRGDDVIVMAEWNFPLLDVAGRWHPACRFDRSLRADWSHGEKSVSAVSAPIINFFNENGSNRGTFAVSETLKEVNMNLGVHEEDGTMRCCIRIYLGQLDTEEYVLRILQDFREVPYEKAIANVTQWWEESCHVVPALVPADAKDPMYSFWYSFHQQFTEEEIETECRRAKEMGFKTIIVDDGWQTDDTNRGYGYCGDWIPAKTKIKDMKQHVARVHELGMKYLLWFSVPYVGIYSKMWPLFHNKLIAEDEEQKTGILDIRYKEIRDYLRNIYVKAVKDWKIDGIKLDFIDEFHERSSTPKANSEMDSYCLQDALNKLLSETMEELKRINPDILIEFRQRYIGPSIRRYGNILRVGDCPNSGISNRVGIVDLRLLSGNTAVHSDMLMWNKDEKPEVAALQMINCLFGTLQFSVRLDEMSVDQKKMFQYYMLFMKQYKTLLQENELRAKEPHHLYPEVRSSDDNIEIIAVYSSGRVVEGSKEHMILVNGTLEETMYIKQAEESFAQIIVRDCYGEVIKTEQRLLKKLECITVPVAGQIEIKSRREKV